MATSPEQQKEQENWETLLQDVKKSFVPGVAAEPVINFYNYWAKKGFDKMVQDADFKREDFRALHQTLQDLYPTGRDTAVLLDVGAGTGLSGQILRDVGFKIVDGLDPAEEMLRVAQEKQIYRHTYICSLTGQPSQVPADSYDCVTLVGVMNHGHLPCAAFEEITRIVKPGGYIVVCTRKSYLEEVQDYAENWEPLKTRMEKSGRWRILKMDPYQNQFIGKEGLIIVIQILK